ncbi:hypothetical protein AYO38_07535 [bacterium SCGC AG-212-C10]|nr:hypothetical protein AYO38_07535 [bacterium SCGC AG-212-C10]
MRTHAWCGPLNVRPGRRDHFLDGIAADWPELLPRYLRLYERSPYLARADAEPIHERFREEMDR